MESKKIFDYYSDGRKEADKMKSKKFVGIIFIGGLFIFSSVLSAQSPSNLKWYNVVPWVIAAAALIFAIYQYARRLKDIKPKKIAELEAKKEFEEKEQIGTAKTAEDIYRAALKEELDHIDLLGSPDIESKAVKLEDAFVTLCISESWRSEQRFHQQKKMEHLETERYLTPEQVMKRAFKKNRLLLVIGDPGSGKTTLLKYYAVRCLDKKYSEFGFKEDVFPLYFPLRELDFNIEYNEPALLPQNIAKWSERHVLNISAHQFHDWLHKRKTLVLLDGLDEISSKEQRRKVCRWVKDMCNGLKNACFVITSRATGYRKLDGIELEVPHLRADIMDFSPRQQEIFFNRWFRAVFLSQLPPEGMAEQEWKQQQIKHADQRSKAIIEFLNKEENQAVQELAAVPMLIQIMAIIWKDRDYLPKTRLALYEAALNYLLEYRDRQKNIEPILPAEEARRVLAPTALWMQEHLKKDEVLKPEMHSYMQPILDTLEDQPKAVKVCENLRDRAGLIADYDKHHYIFRHKSFREFLSALQLVKDSHRLKRIQTLVEYFKEDWWEEALRFFMIKSDDEIFDRFMQLFFQSPVSQELNAHQQTLLQSLVREAPQRRIDALREYLNSDSLNDKQKRYVMDCLKTIGTPDALEAIETADKDKLSKENLSYAKDIVAEAELPGSAFWIVKRQLVGNSVENKSISADSYRKTFEEKVEYVKKRHTAMSVSKEKFSQDSFRNPFEDNVEYIKIPGGTYKFSFLKRKFLFFKGQKNVTVPDLYFCKFPVTNKRYHRFISFLEGKEKGIEEFISPEVFIEYLYKFAKSIKGFAGYLGKKPDELIDAWVTWHHYGKHFKGDDQPVVGVNWYEAQSYCFWLSCLEIFINQGEKIEDVKKVPIIYRLPTEKEWEWAAGGEPDGTIRKYPWSKDKGEPNPNLANYGGNVGATTPVGRYPEGATPQGLMDMAGNVWEWMDNFSTLLDFCPAQCGGSWSSYSQYLHCSARDDDFPENYAITVGFRVIRIVDTPSVKEGRCEDSGSVSR
jgi:formylglycine-generating enzyme required for sulfatase activity/energy-coupling factor transporter ATP-binding protein EcfA2